MPSLISLCGQVHVGTSLGLLVPIKGNSNAEALKQLCAFNFVVTVSFNISGEIITDSFSHLCPVVKMFCSNAILLGHLKMFKVHLLSCVQRFF